MTSPNDGCIIQGRPQRHLLDQTDEFEGTEIFPAARTIPIAGNTVLDRFVVALGRRYRFVEAVQPGPLMRGQAVRTHKEVSDLYL